MTKASDKRVTRISSREILLPVVVAVLLLGTALLTTPSVYALTDLLVLALLYLLLSVAVVGFGQLLRGFGPVAAVLGHLFVAAVVVWHVREQTRPPGSRSTLWQAGSLATFVGAVVLVALVYAAVSRVLVREPGRLQYAAVTGAALLAVVAVTTLSFHASTTLRWHLLRHNNLIGVPAYHALAPDVRRVQEDLWSRHREEPASSRPMGPAEALRDQGAGGAIGAGDQATVEGESGARGGPGTEEAAEPRPEEDRPLDIVYVLVDTLRADGLEAYGGDPELMPAMNRFATESIVFGDVLANTSWTRPSLASFFTGLLPEEHGAVNWGYVLSPGRTTLAEILSERGYETAAFIANRVVGTDSGFDQGFEVFEILESGDEAYPRAAAVNAAVASYLEGRGPGTLEAGPAPLFLYVHYMDPHTPYLSGGTPWPGGDAAAIEGYDNELRYLDGQLEALFRRIEATLSGPTVLFLTSDHGEELGEHGDLGHGHSLYDEVLAIPALVRVLESLPIAASRSGSGRPPAAFLAEPLESRDFFDLILSMADDPRLDVPAWARSHQRTGRYSSLYNVKADSLSVRLLRPFRSGIGMRRFDRAGWSLIWSAYGPTLELYDRRDDPEQLVNLAETRADTAADLRARMETAVDAWVRRIPQGLTEAELENLRALGYIQ